MTPDRSIPVSLLRPARRALGPALLALAVLSAGACDKDALSASFGAPAGGTTVSGQTASALIGRWIHVEGSASDGYTTETTWAFDAGGTARRTVVTRTVLGEVVATGETQAEWNAGAGVLLINFGAPSFQFLRLPFSITYGVEGTVLNLNGVRYLRI